jgi:hypothetical protein
VAVGVEHARPLPQRVVRALLVEPHVGVGRHDLPQAVDVLAQRGGLLREYRPRATT